MDFKAGCKSLLLQFFGDMAKLFSAMFPDSEIAKQFACGGQKAAYITVFGLAEHFKKLLKESVKGPFVVLFDESLNKKMQEKQMDIHIRYWNNLSSEVTTRYFGSFLVSAYIRKFNVLMKVTNK